MIIGEHVKLARTSLSTVAVLALAIALSACSSPSTSSTDGGTASSGAPADVPVEETEAPAPADLVGEWTQTNSNAEDSYQSATITADAIEVYWVSDGGDTKSLYWAGTYVAPTEPGDHAWESANDVEKTSVALLASPSPTKTFALEGDEISYEVTALGTTMTVRLGRDG